MKYLVIILICLFGQSINAQNLQKAKTFINEVVTENNIIYQDSVNKRVAFMMQDALKQNKRNVFYKFKKDSVIYTDSTGVKIPMLRSEATPLVLKRVRSRMLPIVADSVILSSQEIDYVYEEMSKGDKYKWGGELLKNSRLILTDTLRTVFASGSHLGWAYLYKKGINKIYTFNLPVFLRNDTYCIFYYDYGCGNLCGFGELAIYKKESGKWQYWGRIISWIS